MTSDVRLGEIIVKVPSGEHSDAPKTGGFHRVDIIGFPVDAGVERNGGRPGACDGPTVFRERLARFGCVPNPETDVDVRAHVDIFDLGDVSRVGGDGGVALEKAHTELEAKVRGSLSRGGIPFVVGGGNDQSYPNARALMATRPAVPVGVINIDAHLDVRELKPEGAHSGSPFRQMCEDVHFEGTGSRFIEFGAQGMQCSADHARWVKEKGHSIMWLSDITADPVEAFRAALDEAAGPGSKSRIFVSFDIDSIDSAFCPGVSCPAPVGLTAEDARQIAYLAGADPRVALMDVSEFNPKIEPYRTGRLVCTMFYSFIEGVAARPKGHR